MTLALTFFSRNESLVSILISPSFSSVPKTNSLKRDCWVKKAKRGNGFECILSNLFPILIPLTTCKCPCFPGTLPELGVIL